MCTCPTIKFHVYFETSRLKCQLYVNKAMENFCMRTSACSIFIVLSDEYFGFFCFVFVLFSLMLCLVQEVVLKDAPNEVKNQEGGCAC